MRWNKWFIIAGIVLILLGSFVHQVLLSLVGLLALVWAIVNYTKLALWLKILIPILIALIIVLALGILPSLRDHAIIGGPIL